MPSLSVMRVLLRELTTREKAFRVNEPDLVMDDPDKVNAYTRAGRIDGVMAPVYLFHCTQVCEVICPGDTVVDLACGPATQLVQIAELNPDVQFKGVDLSPEMLERAKAYIGSKKLKNIELFSGDISNLRHFTDASIDAVISTMALHHLPTLDLLKKTFIEVNRILKSDGGIYMVDFGHLKSEKSINYFAYQYADKQAELFTLDYLYSLRAAFSLEDFGDAMQPLANKAKLYSTFLSPYMVALKSNRRREYDPLLAKRIKAIEASLPSHHRKDFNDLKTFFGFGGLKSEY